MSTCGSCAGSSGWAGRTSGRASGRTSGRPPGRLSSARPGRLWPIWCAWGCAVIAGCTASAAEVSPPQDQLYFPSGLGLSPDEKSLFVANSNSELRYDSGSISVIDLDLVQDTITHWTITKAGPYPDGCLPDPDHAETLVCDETAFLRAGAGVRIGNFATDIAVQDLTVTGGGTVAPGGYTSRLIVPTRGDPSITWIDFDGTNLHCADGTDGFALCDDAHRLTSVVTDPLLTALPDEPFDAFADSPNGFAVVTHLSNGAVTLINSPVDSSNVRIVDLQTNLFAQDPTTGVRGATGVAGRHLPGSSPGAGDDLVYVGSRTEARIQTFTIGELKGSQPQPEPAYFVPGNYFFLDGVGTNGGASSDTRGMKFSDDGGRLFVVNRAPPTVQVFDTSPDPAGFPRNTLTGASDICREASTIAVLEPAVPDALHPGAGERVYVTCFLDGEVYVVDPTGQSQVEDIVIVGRGAYAVVAATGKNPTANDASAAAMPAIPRQQLFISNFLEDTIAVVDVRPDSPTHDRVVLRIGTPRAP